jgi:chemotaxis protein methyltransferase WspC
MAEARWAEAAEAVARLLRSRPDLAEAHAAAGEIALARGGLAAAGDSFRKALYLDPGSETTLIRLAEIAERQERPDEADRYRERALRIHLGREGADSDGVRS